MNTVEARSWLLDQAAGRGVDLEVLGTSERKLMVESRDGKPADVSMSSNGGVGIRVVKDGRMGYAWSEELSEAALTWALDEAIANAELQEEGSAAVLPVGKDMGRHDLLDEGLSASLDSKKSAVIDFEKVVSAEPNLQALQIASYSETQAEVEISSSRGTSGAYRSGYGMLMSAVVLREGESVKQGYGVELQREFHKLDPGRTALEHVATISRHLGARPLTTGRRRAIFEPEITATLLGLLTIGLSGKSLAEGKSLLAGKLDQKIASELITLVDDPQVEGGLANRPFDAEGTASQKLTLIDRGVFRSFMHNSDTAARTSQANTAHASRSYRSTLSVAPSNLMLEPGSGVSREDGTIIVTDVMGVHAGANPITGDVSVQAMGLEVSGDELQPVDNFAISFNLLKLLEQVEQVGDDFDWKPGFSGIVGAPSIAVSDLSFGGS